jgi:hypothetical protein
MKRSILSIILLALIISLTVTVGSANLVTAYAIENYLQLRSANVNYHGGDIDVDIRTGGNIPSESGNNGFGYAVLTDVGDESVDNVLVAISDIGLKNNDKSTKSDKLHTYVLDLTGDTSKACSGSDYEVTKNWATCSNEGNNVANVGGDSGSGSGSNSDGFELDIDQNIDQGNTCSGEAECSNEGRNEANIWEDIGSGVYIGQSIEQSNECGGEASCSNEASNEANVFGYPTAADDEDFSGVDISQSIEQSNTCGGSATCSNIANNVANIG